jgi:hypothetical protein
MADMTNREPHVEIDSRPSGGTVYRHGFLWRMGGIPWFDDDGEIGGLVFEPKWFENRLTPAQLAEVEALVTEERADHPQEPEDLIRYHILERNGIQHEHRKGRPIEPRRPALGWYCSWCDATILNPAPADFRFIGGPANGRWIVTDGRPTLDVPVASPLTFGAGSPLEVSPEMGRVTYHRRGDVYVYPRWLPT